MNEIIIVCIILFTVSIIVATVYFVITMIQMAQTAKKAEEALTKINSEMDSIQQISETITNTLNYIPKSWMNIVTSVLPLFMSLIFKKKK
ncbi:MAG: hypothetical protein WCS83_04340 [Endomicrobiia bacterium]|nr:hypothetical protein [Endomicrobiaceae bacterium]MDD3053956.1 hypothetical protein [Endomicrobiaceae bacterium]MDD3922605.1 hypothetical protein [Endomicrobiaceae bacterium]